MTKTTRRFLLLFFWKPKRKQNRLKIAKCITKGEVWAHDYGTYMHLCI